MEFIVNGAQPTSQKVVQLSPLDVVVGCGAGIDMASKMLKEGFKPGNLEVYYKNLKTFNFAYYHRFFPAGFRIFEPALRYGKVDIIRFLTQKGHKILSTKNMVRTVGKGVRILWEMGFKLQPIIDDETGKYVGDSEWLEEQWQKIAEGACGGNHMDMVTLESIGEQFIKIVLPGGHVRCYPKHSLLKFMNANVFADWVQSTPGRPIGNEGYGGKPGKQRFVRTLDNIWLTRDSERRIVRATPAHFTFNATLVARNQRIGNLRATFGVSEHHGQLPGYDVYDLQPASVPQRVMDMRKARAHERTLLMMSKDRRVPRVAGGAHVHEKRVKNFAHARGGAGEGSPMNPLFKKRASRRARGGAGGPADGPPAGPADGPERFTIGALISAAKGGHMDIIRRYAESRGVVVNWNLVLYTAAGSGHMDIVRYAESHGADDWNLVLIYGAKGGHMAIVRYAESRGADDWNPVLYAAAEGGHMDIVQYGGSRGADDWNGALINAAAGGHMDIVRYAESRGADVWDEVLEIAAQYGHMAIVRYAESHGADDWDRALSAAAYGGHMDIVRYAISKGANDANILRSAIEKARDNNHTNIVRYLESVVRG